MKTFDIALYYIKRQKIDFTKMDIVTAKTTEGDLTADEQTIKTEMHAALQIYLQDPDNTYSNEYYRHRVFLAAYYKLALEAHSITNFWETAIDIVEAYQYVLQSAFEKYKNTGYPAIMLTAWNDFCNDHQQYNILKNEDHKETILFTAYHYVIDEGE